MLYELAAFAVVLCYAWITVCLEALRLTLVQRGFQALVRGGVSPQLMGPVPGKRGTRKLGIRRELAGKWTVSRLSIQVELDHPNQGSLPPMGLRSADEPDSKCQFQLEVTIAKLK